MFLRHQLHHGSLLVICKVVRISLWFAVCVRGFVKAVVIFWPVMPVLTNLSRGGR